MKFKWIRAVSVAALSSMLVLTGCGGGKQAISSKSSDSSGSSGPIKLKYWSLFSGGDGDFMKAIVDKFNSTHPDIQVEMLNIKNEDYYTKLNTALLAYQGPDIAIAHADKLPELVKAKSIENIDDLAKNAGMNWDDLSPNIVNATVLDGKHYAVPLDIHAFIMFYNKKILGDEGLLDASGKPTIEPGADGFINYLKKVKEKSGSDIMPFASTSSGNVPFWMWWSLYAQEGGKLLTDDMKKADFNNEKGKKALQLIYDMVFKYEFWPKNIKNGGEVFTAGKVAVDFNGVWQTGAFETNKNLQFGALPLPNIFGKDTTWADSHTFIVPVQKNKDPKKEEAAVKFAKWVTDNGIMWASAGHVPSKKAVVDSQEYKALPYRSSYVSVANTATYMPKSDKVWPIEDILRANFNDLMSGQTTVDDCLAKSEKQVNDLLAKQ